MVNRIAPGAGDDQQPGMSVEELCQSFYNGISPSTITTAKWAPCIHFFKSKASKFGYS